MKMEPKIAGRMVRNVLLSIFIYALPIALMLLTFYLNGERPWKNKPTNPVKPITAKSY